MGRITQLISAGAIVCLVFGCASDSKVTQPAPKFIVSPDTLLLTDAEPVDTFHISLDAPGSVDWQVTNAPAWLQVVPGGGTLGQTIAAITVTADTTGFDVGTYSGRVELISTGGDSDIVILLDVGAHPRIVALPNGIAFPDTVNQTSFTVTNSGTGVLNWSISAPAPWLAMNPKSGYLSRGASTIVHATVNRDGLAIGDYNAQITSTSNSQFGELSVPVSLSVPPTTRLSTSPSYVSFDYLTASRVLLVRNLGNASMTWNAAGDTAIVRLSPSNGSIDAGDSLQVSITLDRAGLTTGTQWFSIFITETTGQADTLPVKVTNFLEEKWLIGHTIVDAEFDTVNNLVIAVTADPDYLLLIDPFDLSIDTVALSAPPTCVGVRPDGAFAVVGHIEVMTLIDLGARAIVQTYPTSRDVYDMLFPSNGWVYYTQTQIWWEALSCIELATGLEVLLQVGSPIMNAGSRIRLHPSGDYAYAADRGTWPSDLHKFDIRSDTAIYMYGAPGGAYSIAGDVWISEDGMRLFASSGHTFRSSTLRAEDIVYAGSLPNIILTHFRWIDHSVEAGRVVAVSEEPIVDSVRVCDATALGLIGWLKLPPYFVTDGKEGGALAPSQVRYAFFDGPGLNYVVLVRAPSYTGLLNNWAIVTTPVGSGP